MSEQQTAKDFSYNSGERQTATNIGEIRKDHLARYLYALSFIQQNAPEVKNGNIADIFCGNGYGTWLLAGRLGVKSALGIDGSQDAVNIAKQYYSLPNTKFESRFFPFEIEKDYYDALICYESIEHVHDYEGMLAMLAAGLKDNGYLFLSTPNDEAMPFSLNQKAFVHHTKHFKLEEIVDLAKKYNLEPVHIAGQNVYIMRNKYQCGVDPNAHINLEPYRPDHQFCIMSFKKVKSEKIKTDPSESEYPTDVRLLNPDILKRPKICLDIGCGEAGPKTPEFIGVDIRPLPGIGIISNAWSMDTVLPPNSVDEIYTRHVMEHLTYPQFEKTLSSWFKILKSGGKVHIMVPDLLFHIHQFLDPNPNATSPVNPDWSQRQHAIAGFYGWQREADTKLWDVHKSGYTDEIMRGYLTKAGFTNIKRLENKPWHLDMEAYKE